MTVFFVVVFFSRSSLGSVQVVGAAASEESIHPAPGASQELRVSFPLAYSCHQFCVGRCLGPHVLVLGQVYEDAEDAGGNVEGQSEAGSLLGSQGKLHDRAWSPRWPENSLMLGSEQRLQHGAVI